jgi:hypothetical protein
MRYVCDASSNATWFRIETVAEAALESDLMKHAVEKHFRAARDRAISTYAPPPGQFFEQDIGLEAHVRRVMPMFFTLRDEEGNGRATAMLPSTDSRATIRPIIVGPGNGDPYPQHGDAIICLAEHLGLTLDRASCYPYR